MVRFVFFCARPHRTPPKLVATIHRSEILTLHPLSEVQQNIFLIHKAVSSPDQQSLLASPKPGEASIPGRRDPWHLFCCSRRDHCHPHEREHHEI